MNGHPSAGMPQRTHMDTETLRQLTGRIDTDGDNPLIGEGEPT